MSTEVRNQSERAALEALLAQVEKAEGPDRELDGSIMFDLFAKPVGKAPDGGPRGYLWPDDNPSWSFGMRFPGKPREWFKPSTEDHEKILIERDGAFVQMNSLRIPALTASVDAAVSIMKRRLDWKYRCGESFGEWRNGVLYTGWAHLNKRHSSDCDRHEESTGWAHTVPLALIAAMLKGILAQANSDPERIGKPTRP